MNFHRHIAFSATFILILFVAATALSLSIMSFHTIDRYTRENATLRIERTTKVAAGLWEAHLPEVVKIEYGATGLPEIARLKGSAQLLRNQFPEIYHNLVLKISEITGGASNFFSWDAQEEVFSRFATTFRKPDGTMPPPFSIKNGHPAYQALVNQTIFIGDVPVMGRMRYASLIPIVDANNKTAGALAVDVGWSDDLTSVRAELKNRITWFSIAILAAALISGGALHWKLLSPIPVLAKIAKRISLGERDVVVPMVKRDNEIRDLSKSLEELKRLQVKLEDLAYVDALSGLGNLTFFRKNLEEIVASAHTGAAVILLDIENFRALNESFGGVIGDSILIEFGNRIKSYLGRGNATLSRISSDQYGFVISGPAISNFDVSLSELREILNVPIAVESYEIEIGANIGVRIIDTDDKSALDIERDAHLALKAAKLQNLRNPIIFNREMGAQADRHKFIFIELRKALQSNDGLSVFFQMQVCSNKRKIYGLEALVRWPQRDGKMIMPDEFIKISEETGLIIDLGIWVLNETCRTLKAFLEAGVEIPKVSVNISPAQLWQPNFVDIVKNIIYKHSVPPSKICLEITEELFINFSEKKIRTIFTELHSFGIKIALDDFGCGYSSVGYLRRNLFDELKIDKSYLIDLESNDQTVQLIKNIVNLSKDLRIDVVVEGVETEEQVKILRQLGCDAIQGHYFAHPVAASDLAEEMKRVENLISLL